MQPSKLTFFYSRLIIEQVDSRGVCRESRDATSTPPPSTERGGEGEPRNTRDYITQPSVRMGGQHRPGFMRTFELSLIACRHARYENANGAFFRRYFLASPTSK